MGTYLYSHFYSQQHKPENNEKKLISILKISVQSDAQTLHVHLPNHGFRMIRFDEASDVRQVINLIVNSMSPNQKTNPQNYALRLRHMLTREVCSIIKILVSV